MQANDSNSLTQNVQNRQITNYIEVIGIENQYREPSEPGLNALQLCAQRINNDKQSTKSIKFINSGTSKRKKLYGEDACLDANHFGIFFPQT